MSNAIHSPVDRYARNILDNHLEDIRCIPDGPGPRFPTFLHDFENQIPLQEDDPQTHFHASKPKKIGILGGGISGLYAALILESLGITTIGTTVPPGPKPLQYRIYEAAPEERRGGRLYTHKFSDSPDDYFDVGAMRFPRLTFMQRLFDLFTYVDLDRDLMKYIMKNDNNILSFNDISMSTKKYSVTVDNHPFGRRSYNYQTVQDSLQEKIGTFADLIKKDFKKGWERLKLFDEYSVRSYMRDVVPRYDTQLIDWLETFKDGSQGYDGGFVDAVMLATTFGDDNTEWVGIKGGVVKLVDKALTKLKDPDASIKYNTRATAIFDTFEELLVEFNGAELEDESFHHVISTLPFGALRMLDTFWTFLDDPTKDAIRVLQYTGACKIGISFTKRWWETLETPQIGGVSHTDHPIRMVVYPSHGIGTQDATIIVSYTMRQDALRLGAFMGDEPSKKFLLDTVLRELTDLHEINNPDRSRNYDYLPSLVKDWKPYNWYGSPNSVGAFASFGPGQFESLYAQVTRPAGSGRLHFAGEATSAHHAWVLGALNSAWRAVYEILVFERRSDLIKTLKEKWGVPDEFDGNNLALQVFLGKEGFSHPYHKTL